MKPGELFPGTGSIQCNQGRDTATVLVENTSDHVVYVASHYHFFEVNKRLRFSRRAAYGRRLDIPAGTLERWEPGETKEVPLVDLGGRRNVQGFQGLVNGPLNPTGMEESLKAARARGFLDTEE